MNLDVMVSEFSQQLALIRVRACSRFLELFQQEEINSKWACLHENNSHNKISLFSVSPLVLSVIEFTPSFSEENSYWLFSEGNCCDTKI